MYMLVVCLCASFCISSVHAATCILYLLPCSTFKFHFSINHWFHSGSMVMSVKLAHSIIITFCGYAQQGYAFGCVSLYICDQKSRPDALTTQKDPAECYIICYATPTRCIGVV